MFTNQIFKKGAMSQVILMLNQKERERERERERKK